MEEGGGGGGGGGGGEGLVDGMVALCEMSGAIEETLGSEVARGFLV